MRAEPEHGTVREEMPEERQALEAPPPPPAPIEQERQRRAERARVAAAARWERGVREHGLLPLMEIVEQRLVELTAFLPELARRRALLPRVVALHQDILDLDLSRDLRRRVEALHRRIQGEPTMVHNAIPARRLLADIKSYDFDRGPDSNGILPADDTGLYRGWRQQLGCYTTPLGAAEVAECAAELEALEAAVLREINREAR
jgi:hypothetical protein